MTSRMHICLVSREYPTEDHTGGIATYTEKTAQSLARLGHRVTVITESRAETSGGIADGVTFVRLAAAQVPPRFATRARAVAQAIKRLPIAPDIVQVCEYRAEGFWYSFLPRQHTKLVTRLATPTSLVDRLNRHEQGAGTRTRVVDRFERLQTRRSDAILSPTDALADLVCDEWKIPRHRVTTIRTGVEFAHRYSSCATVLPAELRGREYIIYFGRLEERKGVHILAQALPRVLATYPHIHAVFVGNVQSYRGQSLQTYVEQHNEEYRDRLHFFPRLAQPQLYPLLKHALFAVLPSLWENLANTCLEALDMGKPVVATLGCGFGEVIEEGRSGMLVPPGDAGALEQALISMLVNDGRLREMSSAAKMRAEAFSQDIVIQDLLRFYETLHGADRTAQEPSSPVLSGNT
jgi:glycosyltransferase involved in cell wall biosynthesis